jgi:hypothetical protein
VTLAVIGCLRQTSFATLLIRCRRLSKGAMNYLLVFIGGGIGLVLFYALGSVVFSIAGLFAGLALVRHLA